VAFLGVLAAVLTTASAIPQVVKCWRTRSAGDLSLRAVSLLCAGLGCWIAYGISRRDAVLIGANSVALLLNLTVLRFKLSERSRR
jgi:MtN3 and saliva related transmembrane protein